MGHKCMVAVVLLLALVLLGAGCDGNAGRNITKIQDDGEDFSAAGDEDSDGLTVKSAKVTGRTIVIQGKHNLCNPLNQAMLIVDWSDGTIVESPATAAGAWNANHTYREDGEYAIEIRCYCKRLVGRDSDIFLMKR